MNRTLLLLLSFVLSSAWSGGAAADGQSEPSLMTKLMVLFSLRMPHIAVPQHVVAPDKDRSIVKDAEAEQVARIAKERQLREAAERIAERERDLQLARKAFRDETSRLVKGTKPAAEGDTQEEALQLAARRMSQREQEAYQAKLEYSRAARAVREQRADTAANSYADL